MSIVDIKVHNPEAEAKILRALNLLLRVGESNMQAIADFSAAQKAFFTRMDLAMERIREQLATGGELPAESQVMLNELHQEMQTRTSKLEELANRQVPVA
jgi:hypothetical protein